MFWSQSIFYVPNNTRKQVKEKTILNEFKRAGFASAERCSSEISQGKGWRWFSIIKVELTFRKSGKLLIFENCDDFIVVNDDVIIMALTYDLDFYKKWQKQKKQSVMMKKSKKFVKNELEVLRWSTH